jgi:hypothetical protein
MRIAVLVMASALSQPAFADDPAVVVCEAVIKAGLKAPKSYERVASAITGTTAHVRYDAVNVYNAPLRHEQDCRFERKGEAFSLVLDSLELMTRMETRLAEIRSGGKPADEHKVEALNQEIADMERQAKDAVLRDTVRELAAQGTGIYPIPVGLTKLSQ